MSVWPNAFSDHPSLTGNEGALVSVSIAADPRDLESILESLARLEFPINPQIYHDAALVYVYDDGRQQAEPVTLVEFPAYAGRIREVHEALSASGFDPGAVHVTPMLDAIQGEASSEPAPPGALWRSRYRRKNAGVAVH